MDAGMREAGREDVGEDVRAEGHRLPDTTRPGAVTLRVAELDRSVEFYREVLGLEAVDRSGGEARLAPVGGSVLVVLREKPGVRSLSPRSRLGLFHFAILLPSRDDLGRFLRHLRSLGVAVGASDHAVSEALYLTDPDGLGIEVYRDRPRGEWPRHDGGLVMTTEPLDAAGVLAAGPGSWDGLPTGARIGHVHLHVGDLDDARGFYHGALGLDLTVDSYPGALFLSAGGYHHHLGLNTWARLAPPPAEDHARLLEWRLEVEPDAVAAVAARLEDAGVAVDRRGPGVAAPDPWGTVVRVVPGD
jgi:catechol 2,3-dioxygenase